MLRNSHLALLIGGALLLGGITPAMAADKATASVKPAVAAKKAVKVKPVQKDVYACPMHPDVKAEKEDKCNKCGMLLVKQEKK